MSIANAVGVVLIPRPQVRSYADVEPEGLAYLHHPITGDATGGVITLAVNTDPGFVFRVEAAQLIYGANADVAIYCQFNHQWLADASGFAGNANRTLMMLGPASSLPAGFRQFDPTPDIYMMVRRIPLGNLTNTHIAVNLANWTNETNTNGVVSEFKLVFSYWRKDAMTRPGFWEAFMEAPAPRVPGAIVP